MELVPSWKGANMNIFDVLYVIIDILILLVVVIEIYIKEERGKLITTTEKEIVQLTTFLPATDKMYIIDYHEGTIIFVDNTDEVVEIPFGKLFIEKDIDKENVLILNYAVKKNSDGEVIEKDCKELTVYQCDKEVDGCS